RRRRNRSDVEAVADLRAEEALLPGEELAGEGEEERAQLAGEGAAREVRVEPRRREPRERHRVAAVLDLTRLDRGEALRLQARDQPAEARRPRRQHPE